MDAAAVLDQLKTILVERLKFDAQRTTDLTVETSRPKGIDGSLGLDSLDFIEVTLVGYISSHVGATWRRDSRRGSR